MDKLKALADNHKKRLAIIEKNEGKTFHDLQMQREKKEPGVHDKDCKVADEFGNRNADTHLKKARDHKHPEHLTALNSFLNDHDGNETSLRNHYKKTARFLMDAKPMELRNTAYENSVLSNYRVSTPQDQAFMNKFKDYMQTKWKAEGFSNDAWLINDFWDVHPLSNPQPLKQHFS